MDKYKKACLDAVNDPTLKKSDLDGDGDLETKCNFGVHQICNAVGYDAFFGKTANQIFSVLETDPEWHLCAPEVAAAKVADGKHIAIAAIEGSPSGHVAMIADGALGESGKWETQKVPLIAQIGNSNGIMHANYGFDHEPEYFYRAI